MKTKADGTGVRREGRSGERHLLALFMVFTALVIVLPHIYGWITTPADKFYLSMLGQNGYDEAFYLGWGSRQAEVGHWLFEDKFNGYTETRMVFNPLWIAMGLLSRLTGLHTLLVWHIERVLFSLLTVWAAYLFLRDFFSSLKTRFLGLALVTFGAGFGGILALLAGKEATPQLFKWAPDLWIVESNLFMTSLWEVVLPAATFLFLMTLRSARHTFFENPRNAWKTGLWAMAMGAVYPYSAIAVYWLTGLFALYLWWKRKAFRPAALAWLKIFILVTPKVVYDGLQVIMNDELTVGQALFTSPNPMAQIIGLGVPGLLALAGIDLWVRTRDSKWAFPVIWLVGTMVQAYFPIKLIPFQMQLILGVQVPAVLLALYAFEHWFNPHEHSSRATVAAILLLLFSLPTSAYHYRNTLASLGRKEIPEYIDLKDKEAMDWLAAHTDGAEVVLTSPPLAPYIPVLAHNRVFCSNYAAPTADFDTRKKAIVWLIHPSARKSPEQTEAFLRDNHIGYIYYDRYLREIGGEDGAEKLKRTPFIREVFSNEDVTILKVTPTKHDS